MADDAARLDGIRNFVGGEATSTAYTGFTSAQGGWTDDADALHDEVHGLEDEEEEEDEDRNSIPNAPPPPPPPPPQSMSRVKLRLNAQKSSLPAPQPARQVPEPAPQAPEHLFDYGAQDWSGAGNLSGLLDSLGQSGDSGGGSGGGAGYGYTGGGYGYSGGGYGGGYGGEESGAGGGASGDSYKPMPLSEKFKWFDVNHASLLQDPSDGNFRKLFGCRRGRTPDWRPDFTKWCVQNGKSFTTGFGFSPPPAAPKVSTNTKWSELDALSKESFFESLKFRLDNLGSPISLLQATDAIKDLLRSKEITSQGSATAKLREFAQRFSYSIEGLETSSSSSASSSSSSARPLKRKREMVSDLLEEAIKLYKDDGGTISRASLYALFPDL